ncbi:D-lactate dehydrogenase [Robbsia sp. KACC 23696]|uniref:D-lactate dehydrogenase n=1 Tax=Robbsia sp. KACC 23696 TaxID=3149231 RepID=UPI00325BF6CF
MRQGSAIKPEHPLSISQNAHAFVGTLRDIVGSQHVLTDADKTRRYRTGYRFGGGDVIAVVAPGSLVEQWRVLSASVAANAIVIMQAANTGLTGGSTPHGEDYDRPIVIVNTLRVNQIHVIDNGRQVICLPGATLDQLERVLKPLGREPHSVIGSSCIGASVIGGVCNNSGGSLVQRGPVYTEMALFAQMDADGSIRLLNHLGVALPGDPEQALSTLEQKRYADSDIRFGEAAASDHRYAAQVREVDAPTPARYNADPSRLFEASGSAGKLGVFAVRLDTFPIEKNAQVFYIGSNDADELTAIRRDVLTHPDILPIAGEYIHREAFNVAEVYGKDVFIMINKLGTSRLPSIFNAKSRFDALCERSRFLPNGLSDRILQAVSRLFPSHLPLKMRQYRDRYEHHLLLKVPEKSASITGQYLDQFFSQAKGSYFRCSDEEGKKAFLHRFAVAGAAVRYRAVHRQQVEEIVALDIALRRNDRQWLETLPPEIDQKLSKKLYYGHFLCHVFHQDYVVKKGNDWLTVEHDMLQLLDARGAEYPAEHNVGHLYQAKPALADFYRKLDPCNCFNPGIGGTPKFSHWLSDSVDAKDTL